MKMALDARRRRDLGTCCLSASDGGGGDEAGDTACCEARFAFVVSRLRLLPEVAKRHGGHTAVRRL